MLGRRRADVPSFGNPQFPEPTNGIGINMNKCLIYIIYTPPQCIQVNGKYVSPMECLRFVLVLGLVSVKRPPRRSAIGSG